MMSVVVTRDTSALPGVDETYAVFAHLNAEKSPLYRAILSVFVAERARFTLALRPSEIQAALVATSAGTLLVDEIDAALRQLRDWGNLDDSPDTAEFSSVEEFYRQHRLYQLSAAGEAAEHALSAFDEHLHRPGELQTTALHDILGLLDALLPLLADEARDDRQAPSHPVVPGRPFRATHVPCSVLHARSAAHRRSARHLGGGFPRLQGETDRIFGALHR